MSGPTGFRKIAEGRYRETVGLAYDEMTEGLVIEHRPGRTITDTDNVLMTTLGGNDAPSTPTTTTAATPHGGAPWSAPASPSTSSAA
ncbi:hypothetical protein [Streptomyces sp. NPDC057375]|uniref:hypothetical protein n=1 Tax=Streptomyces sp. NPDC057375 TaxID=3346109 RepID=UPI00363E41F5